MSRPLRVLLGVSLLLFVWALAGRVAIGPRVLLDLPIPTTLAPMAGIFRSTGRFVWPLAWVISIVAIREVARKFTPARAVVVLAALLALQGWDLGAKWAEFGRRFAPGGLGSLPDYSGPGWTAAAFASRLVVLPAEATNDDWVKPALYAVRHGQSTNFVPLARADDSKRAAAEAIERRAVLSGSLRPDTMYLIRDPALARMVPESPALRRIEQDGILFLSCRPDGLGGGQIGNGEPK